MELDSELLENLDLKRIDPGRLKFYHDPIGNHIIELRKYYRMLEEKIDERKELLRTEESSAKKRKMQKKDFPVPKFPKHYPYSHLIGMTKRKSLPEYKIKLRYMKFMGELPRLKETRMTFIENVLLQTGFCLMQTPEEKVMVKYLSDILHEFLTNFVDRLAWNKRSEPSTNGFRDLMDPLETTLRYFEMGGISDLHTFYYKNVIKRRDILYRKCEKLYARYRDDDFDHDEDDEEDEEEDEDDEDEEDEQEDEDEDDEQKDEEDEQKDEDDEQKDEDDEQKDEDETET